MYSALQRRVHAILEVEDPHDRFARVVSVLLVALVLLNVASLVVGTLPTLGTGPRRLLGTFDSISLWVFAVEFLLRTWACTAVAAYAHPVRGRLRFLMRPVMIVDLLAILPLGLPKFAADLRPLRLVRVLRILTLLKLARYSASLRAFGRVLQARGPALATALALMGALILVAASLMYFAERDAQPEVFSSIPAAAWWAVTTLTTVGYGDVYPVTPLGKVLASLISVLGIAAFAIPTGIIASALGAELARADSSLERCRECGRPLEP